MGAGEGIAGVVDVGVDGFVDVETRREDVDGEVPEGGIVFEVEEFIVFVE
jgi:hypothetical protein